MKKLLIGLLVGMCVLLTALTLEVSSLRSRVSDLEEDRTLSLKSALTIGEEVVKIGKAVAVLERQSWK